MANESSGSSSLASISKAMTATTAVLAAMMGTSYLAGTGDNSSSKNPAVIVGAQHIPTDKLQELHHVQRMRAPLHDFFGIEIETEEDTTPKNEPINVIVVDSKGGEANLKNPSPPETQSAAANKPPAEATGGESLSIHNDSKTSNNSVNGEAEIKKRLEEKERNKESAWNINPVLNERLKDYDLEFLVMTVADPIDAVNSSFFDHQLDTLQKALAANPNDGWLYSGGYLPWQAFKDHRNLVKNVPLFRKKHWYMDEPGVLLFRQETQDKPRLLLVYLVGEVPTLGIQRDALTHAIHDIAILTRCKFGTAEPNLNDQLEVRIVGPTFTGGAHSLKEALRLADKTIPTAIGVPDTSDTTTTGRRSLKALIINGSATGIPDEYFDKTGIEYVARTICTTHETMAELGEITGSHPTIWLTETGTAFSHGLRHLRQDPKHEKTWRNKFVAPTNKARDAKLSSDLTTYIPIPVGISRVRGEFERQLTAAKKQSIGLPIIASVSPLPFEPDETAHDTPAIQTPQITAPAVELLLNQITRTIVSEGVAFVGIAATDVRDTIFLAELLKLHCPHVQILIAEPDILLTHTSYSDSLRGAVVASSYPHFPEALRGCRSDQSLPVMGGPAQYGIYNAILLHRSLSRAAASSPSRPNKDNSLVKGDIHDLYTAGLFAKAGAIGPRVWLHTAGYDRLYPLTLPVGPTNTLDKEQTQAASNTPTTKLKVNPTPKDTVFRARINPAWYIVAVGFGILWIALAASVCGISIAGVLFEPFRFYSQTIPIVRHVLCGLALLLLGGITFTFAVAMAIFRSDIFAEQIHWVTEARFFSGVSLLLPLSSGCAATIAMCYIKMRQSYLVCDHRTKAEREINKEFESEKDRSYERLWIACGSSVANFTSLVGLFLICVLAPIGYLTVIYQHTYDTSANPYLFKLTWFVIAGGYVLWWLAAFELFIFQRQLREEAKRIKPGLDDQDREVLKTLHENGLRGVYRVLFGAGPRTSDPVASYKPSKASDGVDTLYKSPEGKYRLAILASHGSAKPSDSFDISKTLKMRLEFRGIQYRMVIIRNQFYLLSLGALLLFGAVVAYPFTSGMMMRTLAIATIVTLTGGVCLCFWKLERDEALSEILGTKPDEIEMNMNNLSFFAGYGLIGVLVLVSQFVPGSWMTLGKMLGPVLHLGH